MNEKRRAINACEVLNRESRLVIDVMHLKRVGNQLDRVANRMTVAIVVAALIIGSSIIMTVPGDPKLLRLPFFGLFRFLGTLIGVGWLLISIRRNRGEQ